MIYATADSLLSIYFINVQTIKCKLEALSGFVFEINRITTHFYYIDYNP